MPNPKIIHSTTQEFLDIYDISNNIVLLKDGSASMIISVNAMNFGLLAEQEQDAIIYTYASLLNSLNYPIQILIQSQTKDVSTYLDLLIKQEEKASSPSKKARISRYRAFVSQLIKERNVLDKKFYLIVSSSSLEMGLLPAQTVIPGAKGFDISSIEKTVLLERAQTILEPRRDHLLGQLGRIGLFARQIPTQEIIQIFYNNYNPEASEGQQISDSNSYTTPMVTTSMDGGYMNNTPTNQQFTQPQTTTQPPIPAPPTTQMDLTTAQAPTPTQAPTEMSHLTPTPNMGFGETTQPNIAEEIQPLSIPNENADSSSASQVVAQSIQPPQTPQSIQPSSTTQTNSSTQQAFAQQSFSPTTPPSPEINQVEGQETTQLNTTNSSPQTNEDVLKINDQPTITPNQELNNYDSTSTQPSPQDQPNAENSPDEAMLLESVNSALKEIVPSDDIMAISSENNALQTNDAPTTTTTTPPPTPTPELDTSTTKENNVAPNHSNSAPIVLENTNSPNTSEPPAATNQNTNQSPKVTQQQNNSLPPLPEI